MLTFGTDIIVRFSDQLRRFDSGTPMPESGTGPIVFGSSIITFGDQLRRF